MIEATTKSVKEDYVGLTPEERNKTTNRFDMLRSMYLSSIELGRKLLEALHLAKHITENKLGRIDGKLRAVDIIMEGVKNYSLANKQVHSTVDSKSHRKYISNMMYTAVGASLLPRHSFVQCKTESTYYKQEELIKMMWQQFMLPADMLLVKELAKNDFVRHTLTLEDIQVIIKAYSEDYRLKMTFVMPRPTFFTIEADSIINKIVRFSLNKFMEKFTRVFKDIELIVQECLKSTLRYFTSVKEDNKLASPPKLSVGRSKEFYLKPSARSSKSPVIKALSRTWDRYFAMQRREDDTGIRQPMLDIDDIEDPTINLDDVKQLIKEEKLKAHGTHGVATNVPVKAPIKPDLQTANLFRQRDFFSNQLKEIMGFGTTLRSLKKCLDKQSANLLPLHQMPSIMDSKIKNKNIMHQFRKVMFTIQNPITQQKSDLSPSTSTCLAPPRSPLATSRQPAIFYTPRKSQPSIRHMPTDESKAVTQISAGKLFVKRRCSQADRFSPPANRSHTSSYQISTSVSYRRRSPISDTINTVNKLTVNDTAKMMTDIDRFILSPK